MITLTPEFETKVRRLFGEVDDTLPVRVEVDVNPRHASYGCNLCDKPGHEDLHYVWVGGTQRLFFGEEHFLDEVDPTLGYRADAVIAARKAAVDHILKKGFVGAAFDIAAGEVEYDTADDLVDIAKALVAASDALASRGKEYFLLSAG